MAAVCGLRVMWRTIVWTDVTSWSQAAVAITCVAVPAVLIGWIAYLYFKSGEGGE